MCKEFFAVPSVLSPRPFRASVCRPSAARSQSRGGGGVCLLASATHRSALPILPSSGVWRSPRHATRYRAATSTVPRRVRDVHARDSLRIGQRSAPPSLRSRAPARNTSSPTPGGAAGAVVEMLKVTKSCTKCIVYQGNGRIFAANNQTTNK